MRLLSLTECKMAGYRQSDAQIGNNIEGSVLRSPRTRAAVGFRACCRYENGGKRHHTNKAVEERWRRAVLTPGWRGAKCFALVIPKMGM